MDYPFNHNQNNQTQGEPPEWMRPPQTQKAPQDYPELEEVQSKHNSGGFSKKVLALCLSCALVGGLVGGGVSHMMGGSSSTAVQVGERTPVTLSTIAKDTRQEMTVPEVYANYVDSTVGISVDIVTTNYFGLPVQSAAAGSGFVITEDGYILTNYHVVKDASNIKVTFVDGQAHTAQYIGGDEYNDIAVIKIEAQGLKPVVLGDSEQMYVGETVLTIGNPLGELTFSLSDGVVSALERPITVSADKTLKMIQTNTTINSGNSGGALFNLYGEVVGIVTAKYSGNNGNPSQAAIEGLGFAIPMSNVKDMIADILEQGYVTGKPYLGIFIQDVSSSVQAYGIPAGAGLLYIAPDLAAAKAGLQEGDIITTVGDTPITDTKSLIDAVDAYKAGDSVPFAIFRNGETLEISVTLGEENAKSSKILNDYVAKRQQEAQAKQQQEQAQRGYGSLPFPY